MTWDSAIEHLIAIQGHLDALRSDGPFIDGLTREGPWWTPPEPRLVALYDAIIAASDFLDDRLAAIQTLERKRG